MLDIYPTLVDQTGFTIPAELEGLSLTPLLKNSQAKWDKAAITQVHHASNTQGYSIRTKKWRYTEWNEGRDGKELYNHEIDPEESINLASNPEYTQVMTQLSQQVQIYSKSYMANPKKAKKGQNKKTK